MLLLLLLLFAVVVDVLVVGYVNVGGPFWLNCEQGTAQGRSPLCIMAWQASVQTHFRLQTHPTPSSTFQLLRSNFTLQHPRSNFRAPRFALQVALQFFALQPALHRALQKVCGPNSAASHGPTIRKLKRAPKYGPSQLFGASGFSGYPLLGLVDSRRDFAPSSASSSATASFAIMSSVATFNLLDQHLVFCFCCITIVAP